ncbi:type VI secretion system ATPase TssH [Scandinavium goeteborgense]|uniref:type VI secretion system ATPase TssH n=1 Tax=Scandinavium goeteborgense TaxID=1851514 RepID=UPI0037F4EDEF
MAIKRENLFGKLDNTLFRSIESATTVCKLRGNPYVELVHWLNQIWQQPEDNDFKLIVRYFDIDAQLLERGFSQALARLPAGANSISDFAWNIEFSIERAWIYTSLECADNRIRSGYLLMAMLTTMELRRELFSIAPVLEKVSLERLNQDFAFITQTSPETSETANDGSTLAAGTIPGEASQALATNQNGYLSQYSTDLTTLARAGKIDPVLGRDHEISTMVDILLRRRQNNPLLTGEAGVGKTAVVEGLALAISAGNVPPALADVRLLALDIVGLSAGASMKGEFEMRLKSVLEEAIASPQPVILFIDEVHTLIGAGGAAGTGDAANLLKPMLARGQLRTIGATTWSEFKRHIEKDPALTRRFQVLQVAEPSEDTAIAMLRGLVPMFEQHHKVWVMDEAIQAAVQLSHRYIPARQLPDKAIGLLDTACARVAVAQHAVPAELKQLRFQIQSLKTELELVGKARHFGREDAEQEDMLFLQLAELEALDKTFCARWEREKQVVAAIVAARGALFTAVSQEEEDPDQVAALQLALSDLENQLLLIRQEAPLVQAEVNMGVIASIVADWTGIPVGKMLKDDIRSVLELPERLEERVIGQTHALSEIGESIMTARAGLGDPQKPIGVFLLAGPSGVGKTETALAIAEHLYGGEQNLITINMSEYQEAHTVSSLKGSPPGYVGYGEGGVLTEAVRRKPYSVVLLDEIEKAHPDVHELFFQVFDKGRMEDGEGRYIDFKNTIILLTSNVGSERLMSFKGEQEIEELPAMLQPELLRVFPAAFLGRVNIIPYLPLSNESLKFIVRLHLERLGKRIQARYQVCFNYTDEVVSHIISQCPVAETGARMLTRYIERNIMSGLSRYILTQDMQTKKQQLRLSMCGEEEFDISLS